MLYCFWRDEESLPEFQNLGSVLAFDCLFESLYLAIFVDNHNLNMSGGLQSSTNYMQFLWRAYVGFTHPIPLKSATFRDIIQKRNGIYNIICKLRTSQRDLWLPGLSKKSN